MENAKSYGVWKLARIICQVAVTGTVAASASTAVAQESSEAIGRSIGSCIAAATPDGVQEATLVELGFALDTNRSNRFAAYYEASGAAPIELSVSVKPIARCSIRVVPKDDLKTLFSALSSELGEAQWDQLGDPFWTVAGRSIGFTPPRGISPYVAISVSYIGETP